MRQVVVWALATAGVAGALNITPALLAHLEETPPGELTRIMVVMDERYPQEELMALTEGLPRKERRVVVEQELTRFNSRSQREVLAYLNERAAAGHAAEVKSLWIINAVLALADRETIFHVARMPKVAYVDWDEELTPEHFMDIVPNTGAPSPDEIAWGVDKIRAPQVWAEGYNGSGVVVAVCDGGVNYNHNDLKDHMWTHSQWPNHGRNWNGPNQHDTMDYDGHGTHVAGTVASDGTAGTQAGVAPEAQIMICRLSGWEGSWFEAWQWAISMGADVIQQSWSMKYPNNPAYAQHRQASENTLAAGVFHANSTGNQGHQTNIYPIPFNIPAPANCPPPWLAANQTLRGGLAATVGVGATDTSDFRVYYSGRGPACWDYNRHPNMYPYKDYPWDPQMGLLKPDMMAPGNNIKSCDYANVNGYTYMSGTSMATPHVSGAAALLLDYNPNLTPAQIELALELTAVPCPGQQPGKQNDYGSGRIDVYAALQYLKTHIGVELKYFRAAPLRDRVRLSWDAAGEFAGFNVYREGGTSNSLARVKLNKVLIKGRSPFSFDDEAVESGVTYNYWLEAVDAGGKAKVFGPASAKPGATSPYAFALAAPYPNPACEKVNISYSLPTGVTGNFDITVYDLAGRQVKTLVSGAAAAGNFNLVWDLTDDQGRTVAPGVYIYRLRTESGNAARRVVVTN